MGIIFQSRVVHFVPKLNWWDSVKKSENWCELQALEFVLIHQYPVGRYQHNSHFRCIRLLLIWVRNCNPVKKHLIQFKRLGMILCCDPACNSINDMCFTCILGHNVFTLDMCKMVYYDYNFMSYGNWFEGHSNWLGVAWLKRIICHFCWTWF